MHRIHQPERFLVRQHGLLHLVHHIGKTNFVFWVGKGVASTGAGVPEGTYGWAKDLAMHAGRIFHKTCGKRGRDFKNAIESIADRGRH